MTSPRHRWVAISLICVLAGGCTTSQVMIQPQPAAMAALVKPGDMIVCTLRNGTKEKFKVVRIEPDALIGASRQVSVHELTGLKISRFSPGKTLLLVATLVAIGFTAEGVSEVGLGFPSTAVP